MQAAVCQKIQNAIIVVAPREGGSSTQLYLQFAAYTMQCTVASLDVSARASWLWLNTTSQLQQQGKVSNLAWGEASPTECVFLRSLSACHNASPLLLQRAPVCAYITALLQPDTVFV